MTPFSGTQTLSPDAERRIRQELAAGETILWSGRPSFFRTAQRVGANLTFGVLCLCFFAAGAVRLAAGDSVTIMEGLDRSGWSGGVFVFLGFVGGLFITQGTLRGFRQEHGSVYFVTDQRVLFLPPSGPVKSLTPDQIRSRQVKITQRGGYGDVFFSALDQVVATEGGEDTIRHGFLGIPDVYGVDALLRATFG